MLAWDNYAKRWTEVFDAAKEQSYQTSSQQGAGPGLVTLTDQGPQIAEVHDQRGGKGDLLYWLQSIAGNGGDLIVGVVHFSNQIATLVYNYSGDEGHVFHYDESPKGNVGVIVSGKSPKQRVTVTLPWLTSVDSRSQAARNFSFVVGPQGSFDEYQVLANNQAYVGVGLNSDGQVEYVDPTSPSNGALQVGDVVQGVVGSNLSSSSGLALAPLVVDQVALFYPGDTISLNIVRDGQPRVVQIKLAQWSLFSQNIITLPGGGLAGMM
jgi:hypothetical protein